MAPAGSPKTYRCLRTNIFIRGGLSLLCATAHCLLPDVVDWRVEVSSVFSVGFMVFWQVCQFL